MLYSSLQIDVKQEPVKLVCCTYFEFAQIGIKDPDAQWRSKSVDDRYSFNKHPMRYASTLATTAAENPVFYSTKKYNTFQENDIFHSMGKKKKLFYNASFS